MPTPAPVITAIPDFPSLADRATYNAKAFAWATAIKTATAPELVALGTNIYNNAVEGATSATTATTNGAAQVTLAAGQVSLATAQVTLAAGQANAAASSAALAGATAWVSGTTYAVGDARYSLINFQTYRRKVAGTGTVDPSNDATNWASTVAVNSVNGLTGAVTGLASLAGVETLTNKTITETVFGVTGTTPALTATNGAVQTWTLTAASTPTSALTSGQSIILQITPGAFSITWPSVVFTKVGGSGVAPTLFSAGKTTIVLFRIGTVLYGSTLGDTV